MNTHNANRQSNVVGITDAPSRHRPLYRDSLARDDHRGDAPVTELRAAVKVYDKAHPAGVLIPLLQRVHREAYLINGQLNVFDDVVESDELRRRLREEIEALPERGVHAKLICHPDQLYLHGRLDFLRQLNDTPGAGVRISTEPVYGLFVLDSSTAMMWGKRNSREVIVAEREAISESSLRLAQVTWDQSCPLKFYLEYTSGRLSGILPKVLHLLSIGCTDEVASRRLGISVRTYRRHVALLTERLGAKSRFEAGVRAGSLGLSNSGGELEPWL